MILQSRAEAFAARDLSRKPLPPQLFAAGA